MSGETEENDNYNWRCDMDDLRICNEVLSDNQIKNIFGGKLNFVWEGDYEVNNQSDLENISGCTLISGSLSISRSSLRTLHGLESLRSVGSLGISYNSQLCDIYALSNLTSAGAISIFGNLRLQDLSGLSNLIESDGLLIDRGDIILNNLLVINGDLRVEARDCRRLEMRNLLMIKDGLFIVDDGNDVGSIQNINLSNLQFIGGGIRIFHQLSLQELNLINLTSIGGTLIISDTSLNNLSGLGSLTLINGDLVISDNSLMTSLQLDSLRIVKGDITINYNNSLSSFLCRDLANRLKCFKGDISIMN